MPREHQPVTEEEAQAVSAEGGATQSDDELFDSAWDETEEGSDEPVAEDGSASEDDAGEPETEEAGEEDEPAAESGGEEGEPEPGAEDAGAEEDQSDEALKAQIDRLEQLLGQRDEQQEPEEPQAEQPQSVFTEEEQAKVDEFKAEWPDVAEGIELLMKDYRQQIMQEMGQQIEPMVTPAVQFAQQTQAQQHIHQLESAHPDYATIYDDIVNWVDEQPNYLRSAYTQVAQSGSTQEVIDLISRFKAETGRDQPKPEKSQPKPKPKAETRDRTLPDEAKKAAASLGVVNSQRSAQAKAEDPNDFEGAWADATREG